MPDLPFHLVFASLSLPTLVIIENFKLSDSQVSSESVIFHFPAGLCLHARCSEPQSLSFSSSIWKFICTSRNILSCWSVLIWWQSFLLFYSLLQVEFHPSIVVTSIQEEEHICHFKSEFCQLSSMPMTHKSHSILKLFLECWVHTSKKFFFLSIFIWTSPKISFKFNMPQSEVFFLLPNFPFSSPLSKQWQHFSPSCPTQNLNVIFAIFLPLTILPIIQGVLSVTPPNIS